MLLVAARVDEMPAVNDFVTCESGDQTVFRVRSENDSIKAYHNVCPLRGTAMTEGNGTSRHGNLLCRRHDWRWIITFRSEVLTCASLCYF